MGISKYIGSYVKQVENQEKINRGFIMIFSLAILTKFVHKAYYTLPGDVLFFVTSDAFELAFTCSLGFVIYYFVSPKESIRVKFLSLLIWIVLIFTLAYLKDFRRGRMLESIWSEFFSYVGMTFIAISLFYFFDNLNLIVNNSYVKTVKALRKAENKLLRQQFNPHFLFNAFNSLYSMSLTNNPKTSESILRMSGMMRYITDEINASKTPLRRELKFIDDYVQIEQLRFGNGADIKFEINGEVESLLIEPLLLITLVENAFKHGFYTNNSKSFVHIRTNISTDSLEFKVINSISKKQHFQDDTRAGKGLDLLKKRLDLLYGKNAELHIDENDLTYEATLKITEL